MQAFRILYVNPGASRKRNFHDYGRVEFAQSLRTEKEWKWGTGFTILMNILCLILVIPLFFGFTAMLGQLRPDLETLELKVNGGVELIECLTVLVIIIAVTIVAHELIHGFFFWVLGRVKPQFGFRWFYAYAACPGRYFSKVAMSVIVLAPLVFISVFGCAVLTIVPPNMRISNAFRFGGQRFRLHWRLVVFLLAFYSSLETFWSLIGWMACLFTWKKQ